MELLGVFSTVEEAASAVESLLDAGIEKDRIDSLTSVPYPRGVLVDAAGRHWFHWLALAGGVTGAAFGLLLSAGTSWLYPLQTGEKPIIALFPTGIVCYEFAMLFAILGALVGMLLEMGLPAAGGVYDPEIADGRIGIVVTVLEGEGRELAEGILRRAGALRLHGSEES